jgi:hypothetical protein
VFAATLLVAGCGDDDGGEALSEKEFVEQANAVCEAGNELDAQLSDLGLSECAG